MLHDEVKKAVAGGDVASLKYFFCDCLDGDPTFEDFLDDYAYCRERGQLFVPHTELHPMTLGAVDESYWLQLKNDFMKNPSVERMEHMRQAAAILYKDRIQKIRASREAARAAEAAKAAEAVRAEAAAKAAAAARASTPVPPPSTPVHKPPVTPNVPPTRPASEPVRRTSEPTATPSGTVRRASEPVRRASEPVGTPGMPQQGGQPPKKSSGVGCLIMIVIAIVIVIILIAKALHK